MIWVACEIEEMQEIVTIERTCADAKDALASKIRNTIEKSLFVIYEVHGWRLGEGVAEKWEWNFQKLKWIRTFKIGRK